jgi:hypothetical protein
MSDNPLLNKMEALMKKHRGSAGLPPAVHKPAPDAWLPVLTDVVKRGMAPDLSRTDALPENLTQPASPSPASQVEPTPEAAIKIPAADTAILTDTLAKQLMSELAPKLSAVMEKQIAAELRKNFDDSVSSLLSQLDVNVREIVREAVAEKLKNKPEKTD